MAKRNSKNQLPLDFSVGGNRIVLSIGQLHNQTIGEQLFQSLVSEAWVVEPAGAMADISYAHAIVHQIGHKLPYPEGMKIAQLHNAPPDFIGFSAIFNQKGWIIVNANTEALERNYHLYLLTVSLGLNTLYTTRESLEKRAEQLVFESLLPFKEVESFFRNEISKITSVLASEIATYFKLPFPIILKRALQLSVISEKKYRNFMTIKPSTVKLPELFISQDGNLDDLESQLFGNG
tara:strand:+ start:709 stop:1413 length:705 start_codon:yes stop_codon:yes gene_type:complete